jgi:hypothetical protein
VHEGTADAGVPRFLPPRFRRILLGYVERHCPCRLGSTSSCYLV